MKGYCLVLHLDAQAVQILFATYFHNGTDVRAFWYSVGPQTDESDHEFESDSAGESDKLPKVFVALDVVRKGRDQRLAPHGFAPVAEVVEKVEVMEFQL